MEGNLAVETKQAVMIPIPPSLREKVAFDHVANTIYVDRRVSGDPVLLTWQDRNKDAGHIFHIKPCEVDEVAKLRAEGMRSGAEVDDEMVVQNHAIEIIVTAAKYSASDIHIMMRGTYSEIQIVVKGGLRVLKRLTHEEGEAISRAIYQGIAKTRDASYTPLEFQNAQVPGEALPPSIGLSSIRIVRGPSYPQAHDGTFMTMRLQYLPGHKGARQTDLEPLQLPRKPEGTLLLQKMGFTERQVEKIKTLMDAPNGMIFVTGPTGHGKTTTLFECLQEIARKKPHRRLVTVEDPVENPMEWAVQLTVTDTRGDKENGAAFAERVRVNLRMAPNIILLGELRGPEVAIPAIEASVTGHQVWTTMHVTDPFLFVDRLELMDQERLNRRIFCDHKIVRGIIAQRLLPKLCPHCCIALNTAPTALPTRIINALKTWGDISRIKIKNDKGCQECGYDGTLGRFAVAEVVLTDPRLMHDLIKYGSDTARKNHRAKPDSDASMLETAIGLALAGIVDPQSIEESVDLIESKEKAL
jgi:general secretion pathway protein E